MNASQQLTAVDRDATRRTQSHAMWASVAPAWAEHTSYVDERGAEVTRRMLELVDAKPGDRVLELACGPGSVGLAAAPLVMPRGEVVMSDVVPEMTAIAAARAAEAGFTNVTTRELDLECIDEADASYDVVLCRDGLMFAADPRRAIREIDRVLRPGGRVSLVVWGSPESNPWLSLMFDAVTTETGFPVPPPGVPGPFSLADRKQLTTLMDEHLQDVRVTEVAVPLHAASFTQWWRRTLALAGPLARRLAALPDPVMRAVTERLQTAVAPFETSAGIELPGLALLGSGTSGPRE
jgi:enediyne biosynthesis protein CalE5